MAQLLREAFTHSGYEPIVTDSAPQATRIFDQERFDLAVLDVTLREGTGYEVCRHIRARAQRSTTPVLMLTANAAPEQKEEGFSSGADNYLTKPINVTELLLWVRALLRRSTGDWSQDVVIRSGDMSINPDTHTVECAGATIRGLTCMEFKLVLELARSRPKTLSRDDLERRVWGQDNRTNTLDVHIKNLRRKLGPQGAIHIVTVKGVGYRFE